MSDAHGLLMIQFLNWVTERPRNHADAMDAWKSSCPRLTVWEDATIEGLVTVEPGPEKRVSLTAAGRRMLDGARRSESAA